MIILKRDDNGGMRVLNRNDVKQIVSEAQTLSNGVVEFRVRVWLHGHDPVLLCDEQAISFLAQYFRFVSQTHGKNHDDPEFAEVLRLEIDWREGYKRLLEWFPLVRTVLGERNEL